MRGYFLQLLCLGCYSDGRHSKQVNIRFCVVYHQILVQPCSCWRSRVWFLSTLRCQPRKPPLMHPFLQTQMLGTTVIWLHPTLYVKFPRQRIFPLCMFATTLATLVPAVYLHYMVQGLCANVCGQMFLPG